MEFVLIMAIAFTNKAVTILNLTDPDPFNYTVLTRDSPLKLFSGIYTLQHTLVGVVIQPVKLLSVLVDPTFLNSVPLDSLNPKERLTMLRTPVRNKLDHAALALPNLLAGEVVQDKTTLSRMINPDVASEVVHYGERVFRDKRGMLLYELTSPDHHLLHLFFFRDRCLKDILHTVGDHLNQTNTLHQGIEEVLVSGPCFFKLALSSWIENLEEETVLSEERQALDQPDRALHLVHSELVELLEDFHPILNLSLVVSTTHRTNLDGAELVQGAEVDGAVPNLIVELTEVAILKDRPLKETNQTLNVPSGETEEVARPTLTTVLLEQFLKDGVHHEEVHNVTNLAIHEVDVNMGGSTIGVLETNTMFLERLEETMHPSLRLLVVRRTIRDVLDALSPKGTILLTLPTLDTDTGHLNTTALKLKLETVEHSLLRGTHTPKGSINLVIKEPNNLVHLQASTLIPSS
jgi:hypothetical protein